MTAVYGSRKHRAADQLLREIIAAVSDDPSLLAETLRASEAPLLAFTPLRKVLTANAAAEAFFGYDRHALDGVQTDVLLPQRYHQPDAPPQVATPDLTTVELPGRHRDGHEIATVWTFGHAPTSSGPVFILLVRDRAQLEQEYEALEHRGRDLEHRFRAVYENALDGIALLDDSMRVLDVNPAACRILQRSREEILGKAGLELLSPLDRDRSHENVERFLASGTFRDETALVMPDGTTRRVEFGAVANVSPGVHLTIFRDIEDRKRAEEAQAFLDEASRLFSTSLDLDETLGRIVTLALPRIADWAAVDLVSPDGNLRRVAVAHSDPAKRELAERLWLRLSPTLHDLHGVGAVIRTGKPELVEVMDDSEALARLGQQPDLLNLVQSLALQSRMVVPIVAKGETVGALSFASAESKRHFGPTDLGVAEELSRRASYAIESALVVHELRVANATKDIFLQRAEHLQATAMQLVRAYDVAAIARAFEAAQPPSPVGAYGWSLYTRNDDRLEVLAATEGLNAAARNWPVLPLQADTPLSQAARTGEAVWLHDQAEFLERFPSIKGYLPLLQLGGRAAIPLIAGEACVGAMGVIFPSPRIFHDDERAYLTAVANLWGQAIHRARLAEGEREAIRRVLEAETLATRKKDEFLAMLGHELRNPLAPILTATSLIRQRGSVSNRELDILERQSRHLVRLVDDLLDISRITSGKLTLKFSAIDVANVIKQATESTAKLFDDKRLRLSVDTRPALVVDGDAERLVQVVTNLLVNAAKFTPEGRGVYLASFEEAGKAVISVRDEGEGIDAELLPRVFDLFSQGKQGSDRRSGGLGLGLAIARSLVQSHHGHITIESGGRDQGTTVTIRLPLMASRAAGQRLPGPTERLARDARGQRLLIVDDNEDSAQTLSAFLGDLGYDCLVARDAKQALTLATGAPIHAAILDIGLPEIDGYELAESLQARLGNQTPKLIALTGYAQQSDRTRALNAGFAEHMSKPVDITALVTTLQNLLASSSKREPSRGA
ncbi:MAG: ATP-binding protein [Deltaproteobacteria bacterium]|nr:ATP-binding protein [Deltaproteobacteria bacterium]